MSIKKRQEIKEEFKWRVEDLFETDALWQQEYDAVLPDISGFAAKYKGRLSESAETLLDALKDKDALSYRIARLGTYANLRLSENSGDTFYQGVSGKSRTLYSKLGEALSFFTPELLAVGADVIDGFVSGCDGLKVYRQFFDNTLRYAPHTLSLEAERLLAMSREVVGAPGRIVSMLTDADMKFGTVKDSDGNEHELTNGRYSALLKSTDRVLRENAFKKYYEVYINHKNTLSAAYESSVKGNVFYARCKNHKSALSASLFGSSIPEDVYRNLLSATSGNLGAMHRYIAFRKKALGLDEMRMYDIYTPIVQEADAKIPFDEARETVLKAIAPLGEEYVSIARGAFESRWIDIYENEGKRSGAFASGGHGAHPYVLLNYNDTMSDMFTLAHELGHAMHFYYSHRDQPFVYSNYTIFLAEVASTVNEALLMQYLLKNTDDKTRRCYLLNHRLESFRGTFFRQTMFAEFELLTHEMAERGETLTYESMNKLYFDLNKKYYGDGVTSDPEIAYEWSRIPHFYRAFYVYQYATGFAAAIAFSERILSGGEKEREEYLGFLKSGSSDYSIEILKKAGLDMSSPEPVSNALKVFGDTALELEQLLGIGTDTETGDK